MEEFDWSEFAGGDGPWMPEETGDSIVGIVESIHVEEKYKKPCPVLVLATDLGSRTVNASQKDLQSKLAERNVQVGDKIGIRLVGEKNVGQPKPMKLFELKVEKAGPRSSAIPPPPTPDEEPF